MARRGARAHSQSERASAAATRVNPGGLLTRTSPVSRPPRPSLPASQPSGLPAHPPALRRPRPRAPGRPPLRTGPCPAASRRHGGGGLHQVHQVPALRLQFRLLGERRAGWGSRGAGAPHLGQARLMRARPDGGGAAPRRSCRPPVGSARGEGPGPPRHWTGGPGGEPGVGPLPVAAQPCGRAGPRRSRASGLSPQRAGYGCGRSRVSRTRLCTGLARSSWSLFRGPPCFAGSEGAQGGAPSAPPP